MSSNILYASAHSSLINILAEISTSTDSLASSKASTAILFAEELKKLYLQVSGGELSQPSRLELHHREAPTDLSSRYALLKELGLPITSLIIFAKSEKLNEIDTIRIIRELTGLNFIEAQTLLEGTSK